VVYLSAAILEEMNTEFRWETCRKLANWKIENSMEINKKIGNKKIDREDGRWMEMAQVV
jgi:hypothetical protein